MRICIPRSEKYNNSFFAFLNYLYLLFIWFLSFILKIDTWKVEKKKESHKREKWEKQFIPPTEFQTEKTMRRKWEGERWQSYKY